MARAARHRRRGERQPAGRVERDEERPLEGRDSRPRIVVADRLGRSSVRPHRSAGWCRYRRKPHAARRHPAARAASVPGDGHRPPHRQDGVGTDGQRSGSARVVAPRQRHLGIGVGDHRRRARHRLVRLVRLLRLRHERDARLAEGSRRQADAQRVRRGLDAGAPRQSPGRRLGSFRAGRVVHHRARQAHRPGAVAGEARRNRYLGDAAHHRARGARPGDRQRHEQAAQLRSRNRQRRVGGARDDDEPDPVAGLRRRHGVRDERVPRQQPQGDPPGGRQGRHLNDRRDRVDSSIAIRHTCRRRCCTTASCTC